MKYGFIGCGNMGGAFATAIGKNESVSVLLADYDKKKIEALQTVILAEASDADTIAKTADFIFLGVKPHQVVSVLNGMKAALLKNPKAILVSMAAGVELSTLAFAAPISSAYSGRSVMVTVTLCASSSCFSSSRMCAFLRSISCSISATRF
jgi:pyrroline-5-carboxylate reductase